MNLFLTSLKYLPFICVSLNSQIKFTALDKFAQIDSLAKSKYKNVYFMFIQSNDVDSIGFSNSWEYAYWGHDSTGWHMFTYIINCDTTFLVDSTAQLCCIRSIETSWIDSDSAAIFAEQNGGKQFRQSYDNYTISALMFVPSGSPQYGPAYWDFRYKDSADIKNGLLIEIDATEGYFYGKWPTQVEATNYKLNTYALYQAYPNPFNSNTVINFKIPKYTLTEINIFNIQGKLVTNLLNKYLPAGEHSILWYSADIPSGLYFYQLKTDEFIKSRKVILQK